MRQELIEYIENNILIEYNKNDMAHDINHANEVIERSLLLAEELELNKEITYVAAAFHDLKYHIDPEKHEILASVKAALDFKLNSLFTEKELRKIIEAIEDHRSNRTRQPRNIYGKIVSCAEKEININRQLLKTIKYYIFLYPNKNEKKIYELTYQFIKKKYGVKGYAIGKCYLENKKHEKFLEEIQELLKNKEEFMKYLSLINNN